MKRVFKVEKIAHASFVVANTQLALEFYCDLLGLSIDTKRPDLGYPGAWIDVGDQQIHLLEVPNPDPIENRPIHVGRDRHLAIYINNAESLIEKLSERQIPYTKSRSGRNAIFCRDPDGNGLEFIVSQ